MEDITPCDKLCCMKDAAWYENQRLLRKVSRTPLLRRELGGSADDVALIALSF